MDQTDHAIQAIQAPSDTQERQWLSAEAMGRAVDAARRAEEATREAAHEEKMTPAAAWHQAQRRLVNEVILWRLEWIERWRLSSEALPARFAVDRRCWVCCHILNESMATYKLWPSMVGFRCYAHRGARIDRVDDAGDPDGQEVA